MMRKSSVGSAPAVSRLVATEQLGLPDPALSGGPADLGSESAHEDRVLLLQASASPKQEQPNVAYPQLDLVFICDCTGSMGPYIDAAQQNICSIVERVVSSEKAEVRFALVAYRDHPPEDMSYVTQIHPFTTDVDIMKGYVDTMSAEGGGDGPEAVTAALDDALRLPWRPGATKIAILIADAPPHGIEPYGDGFPEGDPLGRDPLDIARAMASQEITCYTIGCEPALNNFYFARDFMCALADITGGQAVALASAALLAEVIVNGSAEEISMTLLQREVEQELEHVRAVAESAGENLEEDVWYQRAASNLHSRNVKSKQMRTDGGRMKNAHHAIWHGSEKQTLATAKAELCSVVDVEPASAQWRPSSRSRAVKKKSSRMSVASAVGAVASVFGGRARLSKSSKSRLECDACSAASLHEDDRYSEALEDRAFSLETRSDHLRSGSPSSESCARESFSTPAAPPAMSKNILAEDLISVDQISRLAKRSAHRKGGKF